MTYKLRPWPGDQDTDELTQFLDFIVERKVKRYLEIGSRNGDSFYAVMMAIGPGAFGMAIDLPENASSKTSLLGTRAEINAAGGTAIVIHGNSQDSFVIERARSKGPYDLVLIDADHTYAGVGTDWYNYSTMAPVVVLHDIAAPDGYQSDGRPNEVGRFWREIAPWPLEDMARHETYCSGPMCDCPSRQIVSRGSVRGFGIVIK